MLVLQRSTKAVELILVFEKRQNLQELQTHTTPSNCNKCTHAHKQHLTWHNKCNGKLPFSSRRNLVQEPLNFFQLSQVSILYLITNAPQFFRLSKFVEICKCLFYLSEI